MKESPLLPRLHISRRATAVAALLVAAPALLAHDEPILIGRTSAAPPLLAFLGPDDIFDGSEPIQLEPGDGVFFGLWVHDYPSFASLDVDHPELDLYRLFPVHSVALQLLSADAPLRFFEPVGFTPILTSPGSTFVFPHHDDGTFEINLLSAFDTPGTFSATFQFADATGYYRTSKPFTLTFQSVPTPMSVLFPMLAGLAALHRQRRRA